jgi:hypothetical protein
VLLKDGDKLLGTRLPWCKAGWKYSGSNLKIRRQKECCSEAFSFLLCSSRLVSS